MESSCSGVLFLWIILAWLARSIANIPRSRPLGDSNSAVVCGSKQANWLFCAGLVCDPVSGVGGESEHAEGGGGGGY